MLIANKFLWRKPNLDVSYGGVVSLFPTQMTTSKLSVVWLVCLLMFSMFFEVT